MSDENIPEEKTEIEKPEEKKEFTEVDPRYLISVPTILCPECARPMKITGKEELEKTSKFLTKKSTKKVPHMRYECSDCKTEFHLNLERRGGGCFIATAAFGTSTSHEINVLRSFRDNFLARERAGRKLIAFYYIVSPPIAKIIEKSSALKFVTRVVLNPIIKAVQKAIGF